VAALEGLMRRAEFSGRVSARVSNEDEAKRRNFQLIEAARAGNLKDLVEAVTQGAELQTKTLRRQNALMLAASARQKGSLQVIAFLLEATIDPDVADDAGWTALLFASRMNLAEAAEMLIRGKAEVGARSFDGKTAAMLAATEQLDHLPSRPEAGFRSGDELVISLIGYKVGVEKADKRGWTLMHYAVSNAREELVKWLMKMKANHEAKTKDRNTPLMLAAEIGHIKIAKVLLGRPCNVNQRNLAGAVRQLPLSECGET
ncbi:unnamed protein product, partial [Polarella glacialis]